MIDSLSAETCQTLMDLSIWMPLNAHMTELDPPTYEMVFYLPDHAIESEVLDRSLREMANIGEIKAISTSRDDGVVVARDHPDRIFHQAFHSHEITIYCYQEFYELMEDYRRFNNV